MTDIASGLSNLLPLWIENAGRWIYETCAANQSGLKIGVGVCVVTLYVSSVVRDHRFFGALTWFLAAVGLAYVGQIYLREGELAVGTLLYLAAGILMFVYCGWLKGEYGLSDIAVGRRAAVIMMLLIIACASFIRFYRLGDVPGGIINDESIWMKHGLSYMRREKFSGWVASVAPMQVVLTHSVALFFKLFGVSLIAGRAAMAVTGILGVVALFFMADLLFSRAVALLAASFLATSYCSAGLDRIAVGVNQGMFFACLFIYLLLLAEKRRNMLWGLLSGCCLGVGLGAYDPFKSAMVAFFVFIAYRIIFERGYLRKNWNILAMLVVGFFAVSSHLLQLHKGYGMNHGVSQMIFFGNPRIGPNMTHAGFLLMNLRLLLRMFFLRMSEDIFMINSGPMLNDFLVPLFFLGFICALYQWKRHAFFLMLAWFFISPMAGILTWPAVRRITIFLPAMAVMTALSAFLLMKAIISGLRLRASAAFMGLTAILLLCLFTVDTYVYFNKATNFTFEDHKEAAEYADKLICEGYYIYFVDFGCENAVLIGTYERRGGKDPIKFYSFIKQGDVYSKIFNTPPRKMAFVFLSNKDKLLKDITGRIASAKVERGRNLIGVMIPEDVLPEERGADVSYEADFGKANSMQGMTAKTLAAEFDWERHPLPYPFRMKIEGFFYVPEDGKYSFQATGGGGTEVYVDAKQIAVSPPGACDLKGGGHSIHVVHKQNAPGKFRLTWGKEGEPKEPIYFWQGVIKKLLAPAPVPTQIPASTPARAPTISPSPAGR